jgi:hypothetical protein
MIASWDGQRNELENDSPLLDGKLICVLVAYSTSLQLAATRYLQHSLPAVGNHLIPREMGIESPHNSMHY